MNIISSIMNSFGVSDAPEKIIKINSGHINSTYKIIYSGGSSYILQRINGNVFKNPGEIMSNIDKVCRCIASSVKCPEFLFCGEKNYIVADGEMWRAYCYIGNSVSYNSLSDLNKISEFGRVVGEFHRLTANLDTADFYTVIENFHNTSLILSRVYDTGTDIFCKEYDFFRCMLSFSRKLDRKHLRRRITHNDVKCSNVLFDSVTGKGKTLIDFDTVMPGLAVYDFGDGARSACITGNRIDTDKFRAYCRGYFSQVSAECPEDYVLGMLSITAELAARYFNDYLSGENYFSDKTSEQKLLRCHELMETAESILENREYLEEII
ncbi:MAG: phosphotransferase enzyme family protein [Porcipelethomonas sp.]